MQPPESLVAPKCSEISSVSQKESCDKSQHSKVDHLVAEAADFIRQQWDDVPRVGIILGTGMGGLGRRIETDAEIAYKEIPNFPRPTALSHKGQLLCGRLAGASVIAMDGRCHLYEGYSIDQITLPVRVMQSLGAKVLIVGNASGGINPSYASGDIMLLDNHINLMMRQFCTLPQSRDSKRSPSPYDRSLIDRASEIARKANFVTHRGVYVAVTGPNYETRAEYRFFRRIGGDVVGMSTVPEANIASVLGMKVLGLSTVTNVANPDALGETDPYDVVQAVEAAEPKLSKIVEGVILAS